MKDFFKKSILALERRNLLNILSDKLYIKLLYKVKTGHRLDLKNPKSFNEKMQWLKLYDRNPLYIKLVDKYEVKKYVHDLIGKEYIIKTLGVWDNFDEINFDNLPNQFVLKCTHDSGGVIICKDKSKINIIDIKNKITKSLRTNYYHHGREWPYKNVKPRIIAEEYIEDKTNKELNDYKFFCFDGIPKIMYVSKNSHTNKQQIAFFDMNYNQLNIKRNDYLDFEQVPKKPKNFNKMKELAEILSKNMPHVRVDFYNINGKIYFGEMTFFTGGGIIPFLDKKWDYEIGKLLELPKK
ncbi:MAG: glycosyl transferase [Bacilli bacterium]|nr:glycosyl transferase [Bacilli bacterium]